MKVNQELEKKYTKTGTTQLKTDAGRTIIQKHGVEYPILAHKNWKLWNFARMLDTSDIEILITNRRNSIKHCEDNDKIKDLRIEITLLKDIHHIIKRYKQQGKSIFDLPGNINKTVIKSYGYQLLGLMGFTHNMIYKDEVNYMTETLFKNFKFRNYNLNTNEKVATSVVKEILDHYNTIYTEEDLLSIYDIKTNEFYEGFIPIHFWCTDYYWHR